MRSHTVPSLPVALSGVLLWLQAAASLQARETTIMDTYGRDVAAGGRQAGAPSPAQSPERAGNAMPTFFPFVQASPEFGYNGPVFSLGYEIKWDALSDIRVPEDRLMTEDDFTMLDDRRTAKTAESLRGDRQQTTTYSASAYSFSPTRGFAVPSLAYPAGNRIEKAARSCNEKLRHRWVVTTGGRLHVNTGFLGRISIQPGEDKFNVARGERDAGIADRRVPYDPTRSIFARLDDAWEQMPGAGFQMDSVDFTGAGDKARRQQFRLIRFTSTGYADDAR